MKAHSLGIVLCAILSVAYAGPNAGAVVGIDCNPRTPAFDSLCSSAKAGASVVVAVRVRGAKNLDGFAVRIAFDTASVAFVSAAASAPGVPEKSMLEYKGAKIDPLLVKPLSAGVMDIAASLGGARNPGPSGDGILIFAELRQIRAGVPRISLKHAELIDTGLSLDVVIDR